MSRRVTIETEVDVDLSDFRDDDLLQELKDRGLADAMQPLDHAEFLEDLARTLELGRPMDVSERRMAALRLREMIAPDNKRSSVIARRAA
jgi:hypothetical protein